MTQIVKGAPKGQEGPYTGQRGHDMDNLVQSVGELIGDAQKLAHVAARQYSAEVEAILNLMEQRGSGMLRMKSAMFNHGLDVPEINVEDGYFQVTLPGPGDSTDRLRVPPTEGLGLFLQPLRSN